MSPKNRFFLVALGLTLPLDQLSKLWIVERFHYGERVPVIDGFFTLTHVRNPGGAFSFFADGDPLHRMGFFIGTTLVAVVLLGVFLRRLEPDLRLSATALGMILGGALGNLIDRLVYREVVDFLDFRLYGGYHWPTFNFADTWIVCGVAVLMLEIFFEDGVAEEGVEDGLDNEPAPRAQLGRDAGH